MVQLTRIYTRGGDSGDTSLTDGSRVPKHDLRVATYGTVDEANAAIGIARLHAEAGSDEMLARIQNDLFDLGADLSTPEGEAKRQKHALRIVAAQVERLEHEIDAMNAELAPLNSFVLPGGTACAAHLHLARAIVRRAERLATQLALVKGSPESEAGEDSRVEGRATINPEALKYLNRLSDHLFVLARYVNDKGAVDVLWKPGANR
jgi:cob(I)alamin adenosyltransferase